MNKTCSACKIEKTLDEFYKAKTGKFGVAGWCKKCDNDRKTFYLRKKSIASGKKQRVLALEAKKLLEQGLKFCHRCKEIKNVEEYHKSKNQTGGIATVCKVCAKEKHKLIPKYKSHAKYIDNKEKQLDKRLIAKFGITLENYNKMLEAQNNKCAICDKTDIENGKRLAVDHNHKTNKVRKLLCNNCNVAIGFLGEEPSVAIKASEYLKNCNGE